MGYREAVGGPKGPTGKTHPPYKCRFLRDGLLAAEAVQQRDIARMLSVRLYGGPGLYNLGQTPSRSIQIRSTRVLFCLSHSVELWSSGDGGLSTGAGRDLNGANSYLGIRSQHRDESPPRHRVRHLLARSSPS